MIVKDIIDYMNQWAPFDSAEEWDHVGLQVGDENAEVQKVLVALDITQDAMEKAKTIGANVIITHHPSIFGEVDRFTEEMYAFQLAKLGIAHIAAHTNLDKAKGGVNDTLCLILGLNNCESICDGIGRKGKLPISMNVEDFIQYVKEKLNTSLLVKKGSGKIETVAVVSGGGGDFYEKAMKESLADAFLTGEMKHHEWLSVKEKTCIAAGHYITENGIVNTITDRMKQSFPNIEWIPYLGTAPYEIL